MEWVIVIYPRVRDVFVDNIRSGQTNAKLAMAEGTYTVHLGTPIDYNPREHTVAVTGTSEAIPMEIKFERG